MVYKTGSINVDYIFMVYKQYFKSTKHYFPCILIELLKTCQKSVKDGLNKKWAKQSIANWCPTYITVKKIKKLYLFQYSTQNLPFNCTLTL